MTDQSSTRPNSDYVQSLARGLAVISVFDAEHPRMALTEVAQRAEINRATARRFLLTLVELGYMSTDGKQFWLTPKILSLGYSYLSTMSLAEVAQPHLVELSGQLHESASVSVLESSDVVYIARHSVRRIMRANISVGTRFPAHATSMGRVILANLPDAELDAWLRKYPPQRLTEHTVTSVAELRAILAQVRADGWAMCLEELEPALCSVAAPIHDRRGQVVAGLNVSIAGSGRQATPVLTSYLAPLLATAQAITTDYARVSRG